MKNMQTFTYLLWQYWQSIWSRGFYPKPKPLPHTRSFWITQGIVVLVVAAYILYFSRFVIIKFDAFKTNGEDLGIMDQAIWNLLHGSFLHQTICNPITDTNCYDLNGINRFAIHFEPILFLTPLIYLFWSSPKALLIFQVLVVASGAFPAFWLARLRLRNTWAALAFPLLYLLYPAQQYAVNFDFHAVTLTISLLLFVIYFLYTRKTVSLFVFALLCLACKEEIAGIILMFGLWTIILQRRWRVGLGLIALALFWSGISLLVVHFASPVGHSLLASRYTYLGNSPTQVALTLLAHPISILQQHMLENNHLLYLRKLLSPGGYLPVLAPWVLLLALPTLALNLLSSTPNMYSGDFQYNAEIIPILIFASIEGTMVIQRLVNLLLRELKYQKGAMIFGKSIHDKYTFITIPRVRAAILSLLLVYLLICTFYSTTRYNVYSVMPYASGFIKPHVSLHNRLAAHFFAEIPGDASVSTQTTLVSHLSQRKSIYLFPYAIGVAQYILLDKYSNIYPFRSYTDYSAAIKKLLYKSQYKVVDQNDGYILLKLKPSP